MGAYSTLDDLSKPVDMTGWPDPYAVGDIPQPIAPIRPLPPLGSTSTSSATPTARESALGLGAGGTPSVATTPGGYSNAVTKWISAHVEDFVFIIAGLILVAASVFSFKGTQQVIETAGKAAAKVAAA
jgi:hypothetical protein